jgi:nitrosocyanin
MIAIPISRALRLLIALSLTAVAIPGASFAADRTITVVNVEYEGTKVWVPATLIAKKGDRLRIKLINRVPSDPNQHGFAIPAFGVQAVVTRGEPQTVEFEASKAGLFPISCHLHPAHIGGQLLILE